MTALEKALAAMQGDPAEQLLPPASHVTPCLGCFAASLAGHTHRCNAIGLDSALGARAMFGDVGPCWGSRCEGASGQMRAGNEAWEEAGGIDGAESGIGEVEEAQSGSGDAGGAVHARNDAGATCEDEKECKRTAVHAASCEQHTQHVETPNNDAREQGGRGGYAGAGTADSFSSSGAGITLTTPRGGRLTPRMQVPSPSPLSLLQIPCDDSTHRRQTVLLTCLSMPITCCVAAGRTGR